MEFQRSLRPGATPESQKEALVALFLRQALRGLTIILVLGLAVLVPFFAGNKKAAAIGVLVTAIFMLLPSSILLRKGRVTEAAWTFLTSGIIIMTGVVVLSGGLHGQLVQLAIAVIAVVLLNRKAAFVFAGVAIVADLGILVFRSAGGLVPQIFPFPPLVIWFGLALMCVLVLPTVDKAMKQLGESEKRFKDAFRLNPEGILIATCEGRFIEVNDAFLLMTEYSRAELIGNESAQTGIWANEQECSSLFMKLARNEYVRRYDAEFRTKTGSSRYVQISAQRVRLQEADCILAIVRNITQERLLEQQLHHAQRMEALGRFAGGVVHRFNDLLSVISGSAEILQTLVRGTEANEYLKRIFETTRAASALTSQLVAFARRQVLRPRILDLNVVIESLSEMLPRRFLPQIETKLVLQEDLGKVKADCAQIEKVIMILAGNARDAMPQGGKLTIKTADVELAPPFFDVQQGRKPSVTQFVMLAVSDTGTGMSAEDKEHIFEPFFATKALAREAGLELAAAYGIVQQSGGFIAVDSQPGKGSTFSVYLPRRAFHGACAAPA